MPHRRIHIVAGKRQAVLKALSDMYNLETPKGPLNPGPELALTRAGRGGQFLEGEAESWGEAPRGWTMVSSRGPLGRVLKAAPWGAPCLLGWTLIVVLWRSGWCPLLSGNRRHACGTTQRDPCSPGHRWTNGVGGYGASSPWPHMRSCVLAHT